MLLAARDDQAGGDGGTLSSEELRDQVLTLFLAGYETVANALAWTWLLLGQNPDAEARLHAELDSVLAGRLPTLEDMPRLEYTAHGVVGVHAAVSAGVGDGPGSA